MESKKIIWILVFLVSLNVAFALQCDSPEIINIQLVDNVDFVCELNETINSNCVGMVMHDSNLVYSYPRGEHNILDTFKANNAIAKIEFDLGPFKANMVKDINYTYKVICGSEVWERSIYTQLKNYDSDSIGVMVWLQNNMIYIIALIFIFSIGIFILFIYVRMIKNG